MAGERENEAGGGIGVGSAFPPPEFIAGPYLKIRLPDWHTTSRINGVLLVGAELYFGHRRDQLMFGPAPIIAMSDWAASLPAVAVVEVMNLHEDRVPGYYPREYAPRLSYFWRGLLDEHPEWAPLPNLIPPPLVEVLRQRLAELEAVRPADKVVRAERRRVREHIAAEEARRAKMGPAEYRPQYDPLRDNFAPEPPRAG